MSRFFSISTFLYLFTAAILIIGCGKQHSRFDSRPEVRAHDEISDSFVVSARGSSSRPEIFIKKSALNKEFLLRASLIPQTRAAMGSGLKTRVVAFKRKGGELFMLEATKGHVVTSELPSTLILAAFPITEEDDEVIGFDFNKGMSKLYQAEDWRAQDLDGGNYSADFETLHVGISFIEEAKIVAENELSIRQVAQIDSDGYIDMVEARYFLTPYRPDGEFVETHSHDFERTGFFEVAPQLTADGGSVVYATKFNHMKPMKFAVSANTPKEYVEAIKEGILYWNGAFEGNPISVEMAPVGVTAPDIHHNVVQWVQDDQAGYAYADAQMDPRTGQIMNAQAFITSTFAFGGRLRARRLLTRIKAGMAADQKLIGLRGFEKDHLCAFDGKEMLKNAIGQLLSEKMEEAAYLRVSQDYVRLVVAHEIGHTLGLRHNFAGSLWTKNYPIEKREENYKKYLLEGEVSKDIQVSSSVMDYLAFEEDTLGGHLIAHADHMMEYDKKAIATLYYDQSYDFGEIPLFCTDSHLRQFSDCNQFDFGASIVEYATETTKQAVKSLPYTLVETYIAAVAPPIGKRPKGVETVSFSPDRVAQNLLSSRMTLMNNLDGGHFLSIYRSFPYVGPLNEKLLEEKESEYIASEADAIGGLNEMFALGQANLYQQVRERFSSLVKSEHYVSGIGLAGQEYEFTEEDIEIMIENVGLLIDKLPESVTKKDLATLKQIPDEWKTLDHKLGASAAALLEQRTRDYVMADTGEFIEVEAELAVKRAKEGEDAKHVDMRKATLKLPKFFYSLKTRKAGAKLLEPTGKDEGIDWGFEERKAIRADFAKLLNTACNCELVTVVPEKIKVTEEAKKREVIKWFLEAKEVLEKVGAPANSPDPEEEDLWDWI